jgi:hypothetical protein
MNFPPLLIWTATESRGPYAPPHYAGFHGLLSDDVQKGLALLRSWLSPEQAQQYDAHKHFEVMGSDTGRRYRIRHGQMMNIDQLDSAGNTICGWCFLPTGNLAAGDRMLAQKVALETFESEALAIANQGG